MTGIVSSNNNSRTSGIIKTVGGGITGWDSDNTTGNNDLLPDSASAGIYLGVSSATAANLLDDYEEGTWTPVLKGGAITITRTGGAESATYTKIGNKVTVEWSFSNVTTAGTTGGGAYIEGLPFTPGTAVYAIGPNFTVYGGLSFDVIPSFVRVPASEAIVYLKSQSATTYSGPLITAVGAGTYGGFTLTYWV